MRFLGRGTSIRTLLGSEPDVRWVAWTPVLEAVTTDPTLGSGSSVGGFYTRIGDLIVIRGVILFGTSGASAGSGVYFINSPVPIDSETQRFSGSCFTFISGTGRTGVTDLDVANDRFSFWTDGAAGQVAHNIPAAWGNNSQLHFDASFKPG